MIGYYGTGVRVFACILMLGLIILIVVGIVAIARYLNRKETHAFPSQALRILDERYAKGEISQEEYRQMKLELNNDSRRV